MKDVHPAYENRTCSDEFAGEDQIVAELLLRPVPKLSVKTTDPLAAVMWLWCAFISALPPFMWILGSHTSISCVQGEEMYVMSTAWDKCHDFMETAPDVLRMDT